MSLNLNMTGNEFDAAIGTFYSTWRNDYVKIEIFENNWQGYPTDNNGPPYYINIKLTGTLNVGEFPVVMLFQKDNDDQSLVRYYAPYKIDTADGSNLLSITVFSNQAFNGIIVIYNSESDNKDQE